MQIRSDAMNRGVLTIIVALSGGACGDDKPAAPMYDETVPVLSATVIDLKGSYDATTHRLGDLSCVDPDPLNPYSKAFCVRAFGQPPTDSSHTTPGDTLDFRTVLGVPVRAVTPGFVINVESKANEPGSNPDEFHVDTATAANSAYRVEYDHVKNIVVQIGDSVDVGDLLGSVGVYDATGGIVEVGINWHKGAPESEAKCPRDYATADVQQAFDAAVVAHNAAFPNHQLSAVCYASQVP